ncbi:probable protein phosphatase 2C 27 isoform X4 [Hevea brasiliensis]|uniref:probable protein phosphatase 2C 27 isoform X4 n=1 Tax=Hevea brasiliensis TaxID=3981 RepID=UPI0025DF89F2|nr:probable protein phosphatase 2C 27 isoform X4 [Hevea brasiliensis]
MCVEDAEQVNQEVESLGNTNINKKQSWPLHCEVLHAQMDNWDKDSSLISSSDGISLESICEDRVTLERKQNLATNFIPVLRSGEWSDIGGRLYMEDTHICISDLAKKFGYNLLREESVSFYGVFDGHGGKSAAHFVRDHLPRVIVEDADFALELEKVVARSFIETDTAFAETCSLESSLSSGTTAITAMIFGRSLLVANAGDCRAVLSRRGTAIEMSKDHRPCCVNERTRIESLGGYVEDGYLNGCVNKFFIIDYFIKNLFYK